MELDKATLNKYGDILCPFCGLNIITPYGAILAPGIGKCPICGRHFEVTEKLTEQTNALPEREEI